MDSHLKEQSVNGLKDNGIIVESMHKLTSISDTSSTMNEQVLAWTRRTEAQMTQNAMLYNLKENKEFEAVHSYKSMVKPH